MRRLPLLLLAAALAVAEDDRPGRRIPSAGLQQSVNRAIDAGVAFLKAQQRPDGCWPYDREEGHGGMTALALYALSASHVPDEDPVIVRGLQFVGRHEEYFGPQGGWSTYSASLLVLALTRIDPARHQKRIHDLAASIARSQQASDMWSYVLGAVTPTRRGEGRPGRDAPFAMAARGDHSNTQFAVLALWAAQALGRYEVPRATWKRIRDHFARVQGKEGGWSYAETGASTPTMTAAGLVSWVYAAASLEGSLEKARGMEVARRGLSCFLATPRPFDNYYYVYSLERVGTVLGVPESEWYHEGARWLVNAQRSDGSWTGSVYDTALALLFLSRATGYVITRSDPVASPGVEQRFEEWLAADAGRRGSIVAGLAKEGPEAVELLIRKLRDSRRAARAGAYELLGMLLDKRFPFDADAPEPDREFMLTPIEEFWRTRGGGLRWEERTGKFVEGR